MSNTSLTRMARSNLCSIGTHHCVVVKHLTIVVIKDVSCVESKPPNTNEKRNQIHTLRTKIHMCTMKFDMLAK